MYVHFINQISITTICVLFLVFELLIVKWLVSLLNQTCSISFVNAQQIEQVILSINPSIGIKANCYHSVFELLIVNRQSHDHTCAFVLGKRLQAELEKLVSHPSTKITNHKRLRISSYWSCLNMLMQCLLINHNPPTFVLDKS